MILGGDLGGTKTLLALAEMHAGGPRIVREQRFASQNYANFDELLADFLAGETVIESACFGLAGPTDGHSAKLTYLPWQLSRAELKHRFQFESVTLVNDFAAAANGLALVGAEHLPTLQAGQPIAQAPRLIIGAGTGLGVAGMVWENGCYKVIPGEGGHLGFSPQTPEQGELWRWLLAQGKRVTTEDIVSGPGLAKIYAFLGGRPRPAGNPLGVQESEEIGNAALGKTDPLAEQAVELWLGAYGAFAGDLALHWLARGGVYIAGGIAAKLMPTLGYDRFLAAFNAKREHRHIAECMPVQLVTEQRLGLLGALAIAATNAQSRHGETHAHR